MKTVVLGLVAALALGAAAQAQTAQSEANKQIAIRFYDALRRADIATIRELGDPGYIQHNPEVADGIDGVIKFFSGRPAPAPGTPAPPPATYFMTIAEGDKVMLLQRLPGRPGAPAGSQRALVDIFRIKDGKVAEHWDYQEAFPRGDKPPANANGPF